MIAYLIIIGLLIVLFVSDYWMFKKKQDVPPPPPVKAKRKYNKVKKLEVTK